jgi:tRNA(Ile)-lysidine synthase
MTLEQRFDRHLAALRVPRGVALVAVSGGPDSLALLALLARSPAASGLELRVAHADHGIHPDSAVVAESVRATAARYGFPAHVATLMLGPGTGETRARESRYDWLLRLAAETGAVVIFTAHHRDDQVETILMRVLEGSGPAGLAGIAAWRGTLVRPLLPYRREELAEYLLQSGQQSWSDPANEDHRHQRSWVRTQLLPILRERMPDVDRRLLAMGRQAAANRRAWDAMLDRVSGLDFMHEPGGVSVAATSLKGYDSDVVRALLGALGRRAGCQIGPARAARIERLILKGRSGAVAELGAGCSAELSFDRLRLFRGSVHPVLWAPAALEGPSGLRTAGRWHLTWRGETAPDRMERNQPMSWFETGSYFVRPWRAGDQLRPLGGTGRRLVVRCMQDARIPRSMRADWPVVESDGHIVWVPGVCRSADRVPAPGTQSLRIDAHLG